MILYANSKWPCVGLCKSCGKEVVLMDQDDEWLWKSAKICRSCMEFRRHKIGNDMKKVQATRQP